MFIRQGDIVKITRVRLGIGDVLAIIDVSLRTDIATVITIVVICPMRTLSTAAARLAISPATITAASLWGWLYCLFVCSFVLDVFVMTYLSDDLVLKAGDGRAGGHKTAHCHLAKTEIQRKMFFATVHLYFTLKHLFTFLNIFYILRRTCDREIAGSTPGRCIAAGSLGQLSLRSFLGS